MGSRKIVYLDFLKAVAIFLVIFNHTGTRGFFLFSERQSSLLYPVYLFLSLACKPAVPLFWMVSGALLLPKEESISRVYKHRILRMATVLVLFSLFHYFFLVCWESREFNLVEFLIKLYTFRHATSYWFIYNYIGMMMILPFLRNLSRSMTRSHFVYLFFLILFMRGVIPIIQYLVSTIPGVRAVTNGNVLMMNSDLTANLFSSNVLYFMGGYYFTKYLTDDDLTWKHAFLWNSAGFLAIIISCLMTQYKINITGQTAEANAQTFYNNLIVIPTFAVFYTTRLYFSRRSVSDNIKKIIIIFGNSAFGIMLCENALRIKLDFLYHSIYSRIPSLLSCFIWITVVYLSGFLITRLFKMVPCLKELI